MLYFLRHSEFFNTFALKFLQYFENVDKRKLNTKHICVFEVENPHHFLSRTIKMQLFRFQQFLFCVQVILREKYWTFKLLYFVLSRHLFLFYAVISCTPSAVTLLLFLTILFLLLFLYVYIVSLFFMHSFRNSNL